MTPAVPFLDLKSSFAEIQSDIESAVLRVLRSGQYIGGAEVEGFETRFARFVESKHCIGVANGLDSLTLILKALGIGPGDEVIVPSHTFIATWLAVSQCGATIVPVEPNDDNFTLDAHLVRAAITSNTKAVIPVHLYGHPVDMDPLLSIAQEFNIYVIEDAAQAHGTSYKGRKIGSHGHAVAWSFYPGKNLGAFGDSGAITTNDGELSDKLKMLRNYGSERRYYNEYAGVNSRLDPIQAAALSVKLEVLESWNQRRKAIASTYLTAFADTRLQLPVVESWADPVWHLFCVRVDNRDEFIDELRNLGVEALIHYPVPPHLQKAYSEKGHKAGDFPIAERMAKKLISLPIGPTMSQSQVDQVIEAVLKLAKH